MEILARYQSAFHRQQRGAMRYRLVMNNNSGDRHPVDTHRHTFEVTKVVEHVDLGFEKDTFSMSRTPRLRSISWPTIPGIRSSICHHQDHMDEGFAGLITYS